MDLDVILDLKWTAERVDQVDMHVVGKGSWKDCEVGKFFSKFSFIHGRSLSWKDLSNIKLSNLTLVHPLRPADDLVRRNKLPSVQDDISEKLNALSGQWIDLADICKIIQIRYKGRIYLESFRIIHFMRNQNRFAVFN